MTSTDPATPDRAFLQQYLPIGALTIVFSGGFGIQYSSTSDISSRLTAVEIKLERLDEIRDGLKGLDNVLTSKVDTLAERAIRLEARVKALEGK